MSELVEQRALLERVRAVLRELAAIEAALAGILDPEPVLVDDPEPAVPFDQEPQR